MAVTNHVSVNHVMSDSDLAKQYQAELKRLQDSLSKRGSGVEESAVVYSLKQQVCDHQINKVSFSILTLIVLSNFMYDEGSSDAHDPTCQLGKACNFSNSLQFAVLNCACIK